MHPTRIRHKPPVISITSPYTGLHQNNNHNTYHCPNHTNDTTFTSAASHSAQSFATEQLFNKPYSTWEDVQTEVNHTHRNMQTQSLQDHLHNQYLSHETTTNRNYPTTPDHLRQSIRHLAELNPNNHLLPHRDTTTHLD